MTVRGPMRSSLTFVALHVGLLLGEMDQPPPSSGAGDNPHTTADSEGYELVDLAQAEQQGLVSRQQLETAVARIFKGETERTIFYS